MNTVHSTSVRGVCSSSCEPISELWSITCHMGSHSVTCHPTQVNAPHLNLSRYLIYVPRRDGRLSWPWWFVIYRDGLPVHGQSPIQVLTRPGVHQAVTFVGNSSYMSQTSDQKRFTISEMAADWHELMISQRTMRPSIARVSEQLDPKNWIRGLQLADTPPPQWATLGLHPVAREVLFNSSPAEGRRLSWPEHTVG